MSGIKYVFPLLVLLSGFCGTSNAQVSMPAYEATHCVQVQYEFWRSGGTYWATEYETSDLQEAQLVLSFFESAFQNGTLCDILGCSFDWMPVDVRLKTRYEWFLTPTWDLQPLRFNR